MGAEVEKENNRMENVATDALVLSEEDFLSRTRGLIGTEGINALKGAKILVFGVGGVGGHIIETLVRSGAGRVDICDKDVVSESNCNRQIIAVRE